MKISVLIPVYNNECTIIELYERLITVFNETNFKYEIIGDLKGFSGNEIGKKDIVFIKVNNCGDSELKYLQKLIQNDNRFPQKIKSGKIEKNVSYEYKISTFISGLNYLSTPYTSVVSLLKFSAFLAFITFTIAASIGLVG
jgi:hypothetical protein